MQKALANGRAFLLLAADLTVTRTRRKRNWSPCCRQELHLDAGVSATLNPRSASDLALFPVRWAGHTGLGRQDQRGVTGLVRQDQAVIERLVSG
jgi:hypothetical protein